MAISLEQIKDLREKTGAGVMEAKGALNEAEGDQEKALEILKEKGLAKVAKRADREANEGYIGIYLHDNAKVASMVELHCETDFVAKNEEFQQLAKDLAIHAAALNPLYLSEEDVPTDIDEKTFDSRSKEEVCLLTQKFFKDPTKTVNEAIEAHIARIGENIKLAKFVIFSI